MNRRLAIIAATQKEVQPFLHFLEKEATQHAFQSFQIRQLQIDMLYSGIGIMHTMYSLMDYLSHRHPDGWIQVGIGGAYDSSLLMTEVYRITSEVVVGFGAQEKDGHMLDPFKLHWIEKDTYPYADGKLVCPYHPKVAVQEATGMTSFYSHGEEKSISFLQYEKTGQIENMEGAAFFYISLMKKIPFLSFRSVSNIVETRDVSKWKTDISIALLNQKLTEFLHAEEFNPDRLFNLGHF